MMRLILIGLLLLLSTQWVNAWGKTGHRTVGWIAEQHLNSKTRKKLNDLLKGESLAIASTWMDKVRSNKKYNYMTDWHWVTIPDGHLYDATEKNPKGILLKPSLALRKV